MGSDVGSDMGSRGGVAGDEVVTFAFPSMMT